jgi:hypothetical protein|tara:strand:- start:422 stop:586 length:165 start_codon:yes stop_codon:yes gene_type:complete
MHLTDSVTQPLTDNNVALPYVLSTPASTLIDRQSLGKTTRHFIDQLFSLADANI